MKDKIRNYGFIEPIITDDNYILGQEKIPDDIINPSGQWKEYVPSDEIQKQRGIETANCTGYATTNAIEVLYKFLYGEEINKSDRALGIVAGTYPPGNDPHKVAEVTRKMGLVDEEDLPFDESITSVDEYYKPKPLPQNLIKKMGEWLNDVEFKHEWVFNSRKTRLLNKQNRLISALKRGTVCVSVMAWSKNRKGLYTKPRGARDTHWTLLEGYEYGKKWLVFDSYDNTHKELEWNYDFGFAKRFWIKKKNVVDNPSVPVELPTNTKEDVPVSTGYGIIEVLKQLLQRFFSNIFFKK